MLHTPSECAVVLLPCFTHLLSVLWYYYHASQHLQSVLWYYYHASHTFRVCCGIITMLHTPSECAVVLLPCFTAPSECAVVLLPCFTHLQSVLWYYSHASH